MRLNTRLESEGAEFLVLGNLLIEGILSYKAYHNFKSYDLVAVNPGTKKANKMFAFLLQICFDITP